MLLSCSTTVTSSVVPDLPFQDCSDTTDLVPEGARALSALSARGHIKEDVWLHEVLLVHNVFAVGFF